MKTQRLRLPRALLEFSAVTTMFKELNPNTSVLEEGNAPRISSKRDPNYARVEELGGITWASNVRRGA